jgi:hypothetical protein
MAEAITPWIRVKSGDWIPTIVPESSGPHGMQIADAFSWRGAKKSFGGFIDLSPLFLTDWLSVSVLYNKP